MAMLFSAVALASLLGSSHCVGMCGPLALWASGTIDQSRRGVVANTTLYQLGRLLTYVLMGVVAGTVGELVNLGGETFGFRMLAARVVGGMMVVMGLWRLANLLPRERAPISATSKPSLVTRLLVRVRPLVFGLPIKTRAFATGLLTAFLPCGWLYLFAFVAAGTAAPLNGAVVMLAFWIGTVPLLTGLVFSASLINKRFKTAIPVFGSILLVLTGAYTSSGNGFASPEALPRLQSLANENQIQELVEAPLPCCCREECEEGS
ncbi:MAG: sulfite exporter TauE/SafE family protein [Planctomycetota bacterium]